MCFQSRLVYYPTRKLEDTPADWNLTYEDVWLKASDGVKIHGWYVPAAKPRGTLLFFHGNGGNISHRIETLEIFNRLGLNVLIVDYRGYGLSEGKPSEDGTYRDAEAAWDYLTQQKAVPPENIILFGRSLGGAVAVYLAEKKHPAGLIVESTFTSIPDVGAKMFPFLPIRWLCRIKYDSAARIANVGCPVLSIHSPDDDIIRYEFGRALFDKAVEPKRFLEIEGSHNEGFLCSIIAYQNGLDEFIRQCLPGSRESVDIDKTSK